MSLWDNLPTELQELILNKASILIYNDCMKHFMLIVCSVDARLAAHHNVRSYNRRGVFSRSRECSGFKKTVFACTKNRRKQFNRWEYRYNRVPESYEYLEIEFPLETFGNKEIDFYCVGMRGQLEFTENNNVNYLPLSFVLEGVKSRTIRVDHIQHLLTMNNIPFKCKDTKVILVRKFLKIT